MKKQNLFASLIGAAIIFIFSCQKKDGLNNTLAANSESEKIEQAVLVDAETLSKDEDFKIFYEEFNKLVDFTRKNYSKIKRDYIIKQIDMAKSRNLSTSEQSRFISEELNFLDAQSLKIMSESVSVSFYNLQKKYGVGLTKNIFTDAVSIKNNNDLSNQDASALAVESGCGWRFSLCAAAVSFEGGLILAGCTAITAGVGTPLCLAGAVVWAANGMAECSDDYC